MGGAKARVGRPRRATEAVCASLRLPCDARSRGPVAELATFAALSFAQTAATSQMTKRAARAGHEPCASRRLPRVPRPAHPHLCRTGGGRRRKARRRGTLGSLSPVGGEGWGEGSAEITPRRRNPSPAPASGGEGVPATKCVASLCATRGEGGWGRPTVSVPQGCVGRPHPPSPLIRCS